MTLVPLITWPILTLSIVLILTSIVLALFILLHKGRGGGLSDLFGGGMSSTMGGKSLAERNLDKLTIIVGVIWTVCIVGLLALYRFYPTVGDLNPAPEETPTASATATDPAASDTPLPSDTPSEEAAAAEGDDAATTSSPSPSES